MAARTTSLPTHEIDYLKETLHAQQELLQKLYNELDVERESSNVAADEALSMILRLQGEKAAMEMEASHYKRIAEEKMCYAQEALEIFQELIYQKEMQIASLEFQVQAYKFKLISMGCDDLGVCEMQYPENMLSRRNRLSGESSSRGSFRRGISLPPPPIISTFSRRVSTEGTKSSTSSPKTWQDVKSEELLTRRDQGDVNLYWEEIRKLNERVKELGYSSLSTTKDANNVVLASTSWIQNPSQEESSTSDFFESPENVLSVQACEDSACSTSVQDIFEVPTCFDNNQDDKAIKKVSHSLILQSECRDGKLDSVWDEIWKADFKENIDWEKKRLISPKSDKSSPKTNDAKEKSGWEKKAMQSSGGSNESPKQKDDKSGKSSLFKHPTYGVADFELRQFNRRLKQLEDQRFVTRSIAASSETAAEKLRVLWEIRDKIDSLQEEITGCRTKKSSSLAEHSPGCIKEVMLCFWP
ncbi:uncharacterized protein LOC130814665 [Amaranthus tricolor]|uniref:uncharacterized protein LOC130814665 n=1 Tax=Amaranthus tricolor TaxID=29722 RepID=UPI00258D6CBA|nr:uncharacterized protein LOC130814665 [Amaranthus tricolor]